TMLTGGSFQDSLGNPLANGTLKFHLSQDCLVSGVGTVCSGIDVIIQLDSTGNVASSASTPSAPNQYIWSNLVMTPQNNYYRVTGYTAQGQIAFGGNNQQVGSGATFNLDNWTPNTVLSWFPPSPLQNLSLEVNGAQASSQVLQNLVEGAGIIITDEGSGVISFASSITLNVEVGGTPLSSTNPINFEAGTGIAVTNPSAGNVRITNTLPGGFAGNNVIALPLQNQGGGSVSSFTLVQRIPAAMVIATGNSIQIGLAFYDITNVVINTATVGATLPNPSPATSGFGYNYAWTTAPISFTWPAGSFVNPSQVYFSNPVAITIDTQHDYYIMVYLDASNAADSPAYDSSADPVWYVLGGRVYPQHTNDTDASQVVTAAGQGYIAQVIIA
ncbi:MAG: hypothetical protein ABSE80_13735, partial [Halobacteriota archaeon]